MGNSWRARSNTAFGTPMYTHNMYIYTHTLSHTKVPKLPSAFSKSIGFTL